jgi:hypothetical protein
LVVIDTHRHWRTESRDGVAGEVNRTAGSRRGA